MTFTGDNRTDDLITPMTEPALSSRDSVPAIQDPSSSPLLSPAPADDAIVEKIKVKTETCLITGEDLPRDQMIRLVVGPDSKLYVDLDAKLPGPYFWLRLSRPVLAQAIRRGAFTAAAREQVKIPDNIVEIIQSSLRRKALDMISMARKAGYLITGADKCEQILRSRKGGVYLTAAEDSAVTRRKLAALAVRSKAPEIVCFSSPELSIQSGAQNVWHAVIRRGPICQPFLQTVERIESFNDD